MFKAKDADGAVCGCNFGCNLTRMKMKYGFLVVISVAFSQILYKNDPFINLTQGLHNGLQCQDNLFVGLSSQQSLGLSLKTC